MIDKDKKAIEAYWKILRPPRQPETEIEKAKDLLKGRLSEDVTKPEVFCEWLLMACKNKDGDDLEYVMSLGYYLNLYNEASVDVLKQVALKNWHHSMEDMVGLIEEFGGLKRNEVLAKMALQKYPGHYLGDEDEYVTRKCMWALHRLYENQNDLDALEQIKRLSTCGDTMVERFALHHLKKFGLVE